MLGDKRFCYLAMKKMNFIFVFVFVFVMICNLYFWILQTWGQAGCCSDCGAGFCRSSHGSTNPGRSGGFQKVRHHFPNIRQTLPTLRLALMLSPNWLPMFMLGPIVGLLAWTFLEERIVRTRAVEMFPTFYAKHRSLVSLAVETSRVTAYFTSKATFVQMFKCFEQYGAGQAELIKL